MCGAFVYCLHCIANEKIMIDVVQMLPVLDRKLIALLKSLTPGEWEAQTVARLWKVKDVVAHLLDGNVRILSMLRDGYAGEKASVNSYGDLVNFLNALNADWVKAFKRVSPAMLIALHEATGKSYCDYYASLDPMGKAGFAVDWAGENESKNWMHIAREYTEKFLHQQQIRDAVHNQELMTREFFYPFIDIFMLALPHTFRNTVAPNGTLIKLVVTGDAGGAWYLYRLSDQWKPAIETRQKPAAEIILDPDDSWKLFSKSVRPAQIRDRIVIHGDEALAEVALNMVSVMA